MTANQIIDILIKDKKYIDTCKSINYNYSSDIFQEVIEQVLTMPVERLPTHQHLPFWFYCVAKNVISRNGKLGKVLFKNENREYLFTETSSQIADTDFKVIEEFMFNLNEFENRIIHLYNLLGDMKKVQRQTGISYSALRSVKEKMKKLND